MIKRPKAEDNETIYLDRKWAKEQIPHFTSVIQNVAPTEGIEITLTCNLEAFKFAVAYLEGKTDQAKADVIDERVTATNCLSFMVTCEFLQLRHLALHVMTKRFMPSF